LHNEVGDMMGTSPTDKFCPDAHQQVERAESLSAFGTQGPVNEMQQ
jgi:hypothetical protein